MARSQRKVRFSSALGGAFFVFHRLLTILGLYLIILYYLQK